MRQLCTAFLLAGVCIGPAAAQEKSWADKIILLKKPGVMIAKPDAQGKQVPFAKLTSISYKALADQNGWLKINDGRGNVGWIDKTDAVPLEDAVAYFSDRIGENPKDTVAYNHRAQAHNLKGNLDSAIDDYTEALKIRPAAAFYNNRANVWKSKKEYDKAIDDYNEAIKLSPKIAVYYQNRAASWDAKKDHDKALADYSEAIQRDPKFVSSYNSRGNIWLDKKKDYDRAINDFSQAIMIDPYLAAAYINRGRAWNAKKDYDKAIADFDEVVQLNPKNSDAYYLRGAAWTGKKEYDKAIADFNEVVKLVPNFAAAYKWRGNSQYLAKKYDAAVASWQQALSLNPNYAAALMSLAHFLATCPNEKYRDGNKALELSQKALKLEKNIDAEFQEMAAAVFAEVGDFAEAVRWQERALQDASLMSDAAARRRLELYKKKQPYRQE